MIVSSVFGQVISVLAAPVLTRVYTPEDFGVLAVFTAVVNTVSTVATLRYESAIPLPRREEQSGAIVGLCLTLSLVFSGGLAVVLWLAKVGFFEFAFLAPVLPIWWLAPIGVFAAGVYQALSQWTIRQKDFDLLAKTKIWQGAISAVGQIVLGLLGVGLLGLLTGQVMGRFVGIRALVDSMMRTEKAFSRLFQMARLREVGRRYIRFPLMSMPSALLNSLTLALPALVLANYYDSATVGLYSLTVRIAGIPMMVVGNAVGNVYLGEAAELLRINPGRMRDFFYGSLKKMLVAGIVGVALPLLAAKEIIPLVFGRQWAEAGLYLRLLTPMYAMQFISSPFGATLAVLERQDLFLLREALRLVLVGTALWCGVTMGWSPSGSIGAYGVAGFLGYALYLYVSKIAVDAWLKQQGECK